MLLQHHASDLLDQLSSRDFAAAAELNILLIAAHPDDDIIGAAGRLPYWPKAQIAFTTNGSPVDLHDANAAGFSDASSYAEARWQEALQALELAGVTADRVRSLGFLDQQLSVALPRVCARVVDLLVELLPTVVVTHPYEGGHPDHDATAFAVHAACAVLRERFVVPPLIVEMASYHAGPVGIETGSFLPWELRELSERTLHLSDSEYSRKQRMLSCHRTQAKTLQPFTSSRLETFREAPAYDFTQPPHEGRVFYDNFPWGMRSEEWCRRAAAALADLHLSTPL